jgi:hypothetical protein
MALVNPIGYSGPVSNEEWSVFAGNMASPYAVLPDEDDPYGDPSLSFRPSILSGSARTVRIGPGRAFGAGVIDTNDDYIDVSLPDPGGSGFRWYLVALRRTWGATNASSIVYIQGGSSAATALVPNNRAKGPGIQDDQPLALVLCKGGEATIHRLVDLRLFYGPGGLYAINPEVQQFLPVGSSFRCGDTVYTHTLSSNLTPAWIAKKDPATGPRPYMMIGRDDPFGTDLGSVNIEFYAGQSGFTSTQGDASTHMTGYLGGSNFQQAREGNVAKIVTKTAGLYAIGARYSVQSSASIIRANLSMNVAGLGYRRFAPVNSETAGNAAGTYLELSATDTMYMPAGAAFTPRWSTYGTTRLRFWYMWMTRLAD